MITYKDQAWCTSSLNAGCANKKCMRNYTDEEHQQNINGVDLPLSMGTFRSDDCGYKEPTNE